MIAFVLGNGQSRRNINLELLKTQGVVYGCNALYRDFVPHVLVATDTLISKEIQMSGYSQQNKFYTRRPIDGLGAIKIESRYFGFSSGQVAVSLAAAAGHELIYLLGFDMGPNTDGKFNNVYAGTEFYKRVGADPTFTGNWKKQLCQILDDFPHYSFVRVAGSETELIQEFESRRNYKTLPVADFLQRINN
jgi:hypothetical protein